MTDERSQTTTMDYNAQGQLSSVTDPLTHATGFGYDKGDLSTVTDALSRTSNFFADSLGRTTAVRDPLGNRVRTGYDVRNRPIGYIVSIASIGAMHTLAAIYTGGFNTNVMKLLRDPSQSGSRRVLVVLAGLGLVFSLFFFVSLAFSFEKLGTDLVTRADNAVAFVSGIFVSALAAILYEKWVVKHSA